MGAEGSSTGGQQAASGGLGLFSNFLGTMQTISGLKSASVQVLKSAKFNEQIIDAQLTRQIKSLTKDASVTTAKQAAGFAGSGISLSSGSALDIMSETIGSIEEEIDDLNVSADLSRRALFMDALAQSEGFRRQAFGAGIQGGFRQAEQAGRTAFAITGGG